METHQEYGPFFPIEIPYFSLIAELLTFFPTEELKETHLAPLANSFGRSSSTSTIKPDAAATEENASLSQTPIALSPNLNGIGEVPLLFYIMLPINIKMSH